MGHFEALAKAVKIRMLVMDVDGVLTNGDVSYTSSGEEIKTFNIKDGYGIVNAEKNGIVTVIITGRSSIAVAQRAKELNISHVYQGVGDKLAVLKQLCEQLSISLDHVAYVGDDIPDLTVLQNVGLACCPRDAVDEILAVCDDISSRDGGRGAVREIVDMILQAKVRDKTSEPLISRQTVKD